MEDVLLMLLKSQRGQSRILEVVIAATIILMTFAAAYFLINVSNVKVLQEREDLDRLGYNTLHRLVESGVFEQTVEVRLQADFLKTIIQKSLPPETYFNLTIFICSDQGSIIKLEPHPSYPPMSNAPKDTFINALETSSSSIIYTSKSGKIYYVVLVLAKVG